MLEIELLRFLGSELAGSHEVPCFFNFMGFKGLCCEDVIKILHSHVALDSLLDEY
jgi:hypothetical protein